MQLPHSSSKDIKGFKDFQNRNADNLFSVNESRRNPYFNIVEKKQGRVNCKKIEKICNKKTERSKNI